MKVELDLDVLEQLNIDANQYLILLKLSTTTILNQLIDKKTKIQGEDIAYLLKNGYILHRDPNGIICDNIDLDYKINPNILNIFKPPFNNYFEEFYDAYPAFKPMIGGMSNQRLLRDRKKDCEKLYNQLINNDKTKHELIIDKINDDAHPTQICYLPSMYIWLNRINIEDLVLLKKQSKPRLNTYGDNLI
jgi:hypothetical protein